MMDVQDCWINCNDSYIIYQCNGADDKQKHAQMRVM